MLKRQSNRLLETAIILFSKRPGDATVDNTEHC